MLAVDDPDRLGVDLAACVDQSKPLLWPIMAFFFPSSIRIMPVEIHNIPVDEDGPIDLCSKFAG